MSTNAAYVLPVIGQGATELAYSDRYPYTITWVSPSGKTFKARADKATRTDSNGMDESQAYTFDPDPNGAEVEVRWTGKGWKRRGRTAYFRIGVRQKYHDYSF